MIRHNRIGAPRIGVSSTVCSKTRSKAWKSAVFSKELHARDAAIQSYRYFFLFSQVK